MEKQDGGPQGVDVSHRGGPVGFVDVRGDGKLLKFPEYKGNNFFMSLGNIAATGRVSLLFIDYISGAAVVACGSGRYVAESQRHFSVRLMQIPYICMTQ